MEAASELRCVLQGAPTGVPYIDVVAVGQEDFVPLTKRTVCYIVAAVLLNDDGEVLMMQEAKSSCYGMWYLPAGRMEPGETIQEGAMREVEEETGIKFRPTSLLCVETQSGFWYRFTLVGHAVGGKLKIPADKDKESIQAKWCPVDQIQAGHKAFPLRAKDILPLIDTAVKRRASVKPPADLLPRANPHTNLLLRCVLIWNNQDSSEMHVLLSNSPHPHLPVGMIATTDVSLQASIQRLLHSVMGHGNLHIKIHGVLSVEYSGKPARLNDGVCLSLLVTLDNKTHTLPPTHGKKYEWCELSTDLKSELSARCESSVCIPIISCQNWSGDS